MPEISEEDVHNAVAWLNDPEMIKQSAAARAQRLTLEHLRKATLALVKQLHTDKPLGAQETEAYASEQYKKYVDKLTEWIYKDEWYRATREAKAVLIEAWQTQSANRRSVKL